MTVTPEALEGAVRSGDATRVRALLAGADETARKACVPAVKALSAAARDSRLGRAAAAAAAVARVGTYPGAAAVATALRTRTWEWSSAQDHVVAVLVERAPRWLPDVVERLASFEPADDWSSPWDVVEELRRSAGLPRPRTAPYLRGLAVSLNDRWDRPAVDLPAVLRSDAEVRSLLLDLLQVTGIGEVLSGRDTTWRPRGNGRGNEPVPAPPEQTWSGALRTLSDDGLLQRDALLDAVLDVLLRGGKRDHLTFFQALHADLQPSADEVLERLRSYSRLVSDGSGPAASSAQKLLRSLDADGRLEIDTALEVSRGALARREKGIAVTQLSWLEQLAAREPGRGDDVAAAVGDAFAHERRDVQERALTALRRVRARAALSDAVLEDLRLSAAALPATLHTQAAEVLGGAVAVEDVPAAPVVPGPLPAPDGPVRNLGELADAVAHHLETGDLRSAERVLDGVAALAAPDRAAFAAAMEPFRPRVAVPSTPGGRPQPALFALQPVAGLLHVLLHEPGPRSGLLSRLRGPAPVGWTDPDGVAGCLSVRAQEVARQVAAGRSRRLLALPARATGATDPAAVVAALEQDARTGGDAWRADLEQAFLRLPRDAAHPALLDRLARCATPAALWLRAVLARGWPESGMVVAAVAPTVRRWGRTVPTANAGAPVVDVGPPAPEPLVGDRSLLHRALTTVPPLPARAGQEWWESDGDSALQVLLTLPSHRDVAAAHLAADAVWTSRRLSDAARECLALLPEADGPTGPATALALGYAAGNSDVASRTAVVDALHGFAARGGLDAASAGAVLGHLLTRADVKPGRVAATFAEAVRGPVSARALVWSVLHGALPSLLASSRRGVADIVAVAGEAAASVGARGTVAGLDAVVDAAGSSRLQVEARRLRDVLAAGAGCPA